MATPQTLLDRLLTLAGSRWAWHEKKVCQHLEIKVGAETKSQRSQLSDLLTSVKRGKYRVAGSDDWIFILDTASSTDVEPVYMGGVDLKDAENTSGIWIETCGMENFANNSLSVSPTVSARVRWFISPPRAPHDFVSPGDLLGDFGLLTTVKKHNGYLEWYSRCFDSEDACIFRDVVMPEMFTSFHHLWSEPR